MRSWIAAGTLVLTLTACADVTPSRSYTLYSDKLDETSQLSRYRGELSDSDIALLDGKITFTETYYRDAPACKRIKDGYPTPAESVALRHWSEIRASYFQEFHALELKTGAASDKVAPIALRYIDSLEEDLRLSTALIGDLADGKISYCQFATLQKAQIIASTDHAAPLRHEMIAMMAQENYSNPTGVANGPYSNPQFGPTGSSGAWSTGAQGGAHH